MDVGGHPFALSEGILHAISSQECVMDGKLHGVANTPHVFCNPVTQSHGAHHIGCIVSDGKDVCCCSEMQGINFFCS